MRPPVRAGIWRLAGIAILIVILSRLEPDVLAEIVAQADLSCLLAALLLNLVIILLKAWRWRVLLRLQGLHLGLGRLLIFYLSSLFLGIVTPGQLGELARAVYLHRAGICSIAEGSASVLVDRVLDLALLVVLAMVGLVWLTPLPQTAELAWLGWLGLGIVILGAGTWPLWAHRLGRIVEQIARGLHRHRIADTVHDFFTALRSFQTPGVSWAVLLTLSAQALVFLQADLIARSLGLGSFGWHIIPIFSIVNLVSILPVSVLGLGTREAALIYLLAPYGVHLTHTVAFSGGIIVVVYLSVAVVGFLAWTRYPMRRETPTAARM